MARTRNLVQSVKWGGRIPKPLADKVNALLEDPLRPGHVQLGAQKQLLTQLLVRYLDELERDTSQRLIPMRENELRVCVLELRKEVAELKKQLAAQVNPTTK